MPPNTNASPPAPSGRFFTPLEQGGLQCQRPAGSPAGDGIACGHGTGGPGTGGPGTGGHGIDGGGTDDRGIGPLRNGNHRGDPNLAPRCGAKRRTTGCACRAPAMPNGRCRLHGGKSTGPRTPEGKARTVAAHTTHGWFAASGAPKRALQRYMRSLVLRIDLTDRATLLQEYLPPEMARRLDLAPPELHGPKHPSQVAVEAQLAAAAGNARHGRVGAGRAAGSGPAVAEKAGRMAQGRATLGRMVPAMADWRGAERAVAQLEVAALAPWRAAVAFARTAKRAARAAAREARAQMAVGDVRRRRANPLNREAAAQAAGSRAVGVGAATTAGMPRGPELASVLAGTNLLYRELVMWAAGLRPGFGGQPWVVGPDAPHPAVGRPAVAGPSVVRPAIERLRGQASVGWNRDRRRARPTL